jgi:hypothetical protein
MVYRVPSGSRYLQCTACRRVRSRVYWPSSRLIVSESFDCRHHSLLALERGCLLVSAPSLEVHPMRHHFYRAGEKVSQNTAEAVSALCRVTSRSSCRFCRHLITHRYSLTSHARNSESEGQASICSPAPHKGNSAAHTVNSTRNSAVRVCQALSF